MFSVTGVEAVNSVPQSPPVPFWVDTSPRSGIRFEWAAWARYRLYPRIPQNRIAGTGSVSPPFLSNTTVGRRCHRVLVASDVFFRPNESSKAAKLPSALSSPEITGLMKPGYCCSSQKLKLPGDRSINNNGILSGPQFQSTACGRRGPRRGGNSRAYVITRTDGNYPAIQYQ